MLSFVRSPTFDNSDRKLTALFFLGLLQNNNIIKYIIILYTYYIKAVYTQGTKYGNDLKTWA